MTRRNRAPASNRKGRRRPLQRGRTPPPSKSQEPKTGDEEGFLFDPYWDEIFASYYDPTLHTCCRLKY